MCKCINIEVGSYSNQTELPRPTHMIGRKNEGSENDTICVDSCLVEEILWLWQKGIHTTGCCCGHNTLPAYIGVSIEDIPKMMFLGYDIQPNVLDLTRKDGFKPKTV